MVPARRCRRSEHNEEREREVDGEPREDRKPLGSPYRGCLGCEEQHHGAHDQPRAAGEDERAIVAPSEPPPDSAAKVARAFIA